MIPDEVTSALEPATEAEIRTDVGSLDGAMTIVAITRRPARVDVTDRLHELGPTDLSW